MTEKPAFTAGTLRAVPVRVHAYATRGVFMLCDAENQGCWTDPEGRVLLPTLDLVDRVLAAHGYERREMAVQKLETAGEPAASQSEPTPPPTTESSDSSEPAPSPPEPPAPASEEKPPRSTSTERKRRS